AGAHPHGRVGPRRRRPLHDHHPRGPHRRERCGGRRRAQHARRPRRLTPAAEADRPPPRTPPAHSTDPGAAMTTTPAPADLTALTVGQELARTRHEISRDTLEDYAGASGDCIAIPYNVPVAAEAGLRAVSAHGILTMGAAVTGLLDALPDPAAVRGSATGFTDAVPVLATGS